MSKRLKIILWSALFAGLGLLALDYWRWGPASGSGLLGFPGWLAWFVGLQILLAICVALFARFYWRDAGRNAEEQ